jgi:hypothetical protein
MIQFTPTGERYVDQQRAVSARFPTGQFVAIDQGQAIADAPTHRELVHKLQSQGRSPKDLLIVQAGVQYAASAVIL